MSAATVYISESNGVGEVVTDNITNINFGSVDQPNIVAASHPIIQGEYSYFKMLRFKVQSLGTSTTIKDLRVWKSSGTYVASEQIYFVLAAGFAYVQPSQTPHPNPPYNSLGGIPTSDPGNENVQIGGISNGKFPDDVAVPGYSNYFALQLATGPSTPVGPVNQKVITLQYDET